MTGQTMTDRPRWADRLDIVGSEIFLRYRKRLLLFWPLFVTSATVVLAGNLEGETRTLSLAVYALLETPDGDDAARTLVLASLVLSTLSVVLYEVFRRRARLR